MKDGVQLCFRFQRSKFLLQLLKVDLQFEEKKTKATFPMSLQTAKGIVSQIKVKLKSTTGVSKDDQQSLLSLVENLESILNNPVSPNLDTTETPLKLDDFDDILDQVIIESNVSNIDDSSDQKEQISQPVAVMLVILV